MQESFFPGQFLLSTLTHTAQTTTGVLLEKQSVKNIRKQQCLLLNFCGGYIYVYTMPFHAHFFTFSTNTMNRRACTHNYINVFGCDPDCSFKKNFVWENRPTSVFRGVCNVQFAVVFVTSLDSKNIYYRVHSHELDSENVCCLLHSDKMDSENIHCIVHSHQVGRRLHIGYVVNKRVFT